MNDRNIFKTPVRSLSVRPKQISSVPINDNKQKLGRARSVSTNKRKKTISKIEQKQLEDLESSFHEKLTLKNYVDEYFLSRHKKLGSKSTMLQLGDCAVTLEQALKSVVQEQEKNVAKHLELIERSIFPDIYQHARAGFNVLLYGVGSKIEVLDRFRNRYLKDENCIVVPGYNSSITTLKVLQKIQEEYLPSEHIRSSSRQPQVLFDLLSEYFKSQNNLDPIYILIHNLDRKPLMHDIQYLIKLADTSNVTVIASVDHVRCDYYLFKWIRSNWIWIETTTYARYMKELILTHAHRTNDYETPHESHMNSLRAILSSVPVSTKRLFLILAQYQVEHTRALGSNSSQYEGMPLDVLFRQARDEFLVSSELNLRHQLTEFKDHKLVYFKGFGTHQYAKVNLDRAILTEFIEHFEDF